MNGIELIRQLIRQQTVSIGQPVTNLHGASSGVSPGLAISRDATWAVMRVPGTQFSSLAEFYAAWSSQITHAVTLVQAVEGAIAIGDAFQVTGAIGGAQSTYLARGSVQAEVPIVAQLEIETLQGLGEFIVYLDGVLQRRGTGRLTLTLAIDVGPHTIEVLGTATAWAVALPPSVRVLPTNESLDPPVWSSVIGGYVDPNSAVPAVRLDWFSDSRVGGWILKRRELTDLGQIMVVTPVDRGGEFGIELAGDFTGAITIGQDMLAGREPMGAILQDTYDTVSNRTQVRLRLPSGRLTTGASWVNRLASAGQFVELARIKRANAAAVVTYVDARITMGRGYDYVLQAFGLLDDFVVGPPSTVEYVRAGDDVAPGSIALRSTPVVLDGRVIIKYSTPSDADYAGVRVYYRNEQIASTSTGSNTTTTLNDTGQSWVVNQWVNYIVAIIAGTGAGQFREIVSNTATQLTITAAWNTTPNATSTYAIYRPQLLMTDYGLAAADDELTFEPPDYGAYYFRTFDWSSNEQTVVDAFVWVYTTENDQEFNSTPRTSLLVDGRTQDGAASITVARLTFQCHPAFTDMTSGTSSGANTDTTLNVAGTPWVVDQWKSDSDLNRHYYVRISAGTAAGQMRRIVSNTTGQLTIDLAWQANGVIPDATSQFVIQNGGTQYRRNSAIWIPVFQPEFVARSAVGDLIEFYSAVNGLPLEPVKRVFLDPDTVAQIANVIIAENQANVLDIALDTPDDDVKYWRIYARRGDVASSVSGTSTGSNTSSTLNDTTKSWTLNQWTGYVVAVTGGTGAGQVRVIQSNTATQLTVEQVWVTVPNATSTYKIYAPRWPTANADRSTTNILEQYLRGEYQNSQTSTAFSAAGSGSDDGLWYVVIVPINSFNDPGPALYAVTIVDGIGSNDPSLANLSVTANDNGAVVFNKVGWDHNAINGTGGTSTGSNTSTTLNDTGKSWTVNQWTNYRVEIVAGLGAGQSRTVSSNTATQLTISSAWTTTPNATSKYEVYVMGARIYAYRDDLGPPSEIEVTGGTHRNVRQDTDADFVNGNDTDAVAAKGSYLHTVPGVARTTASQGATAGWIDPDGGDNGTNSLSVAVISPGTNSATVAAGNRLYNKLGDPTIDSKVDASDDLYTLSFRVTASGTFLSGVNLSTRSRVTLEYSTNGGGAWTGVGGVYDVTATPGQSSAQTFTPTVSIPGALTQVWIRLVLDVSVTSTSGGASGSGSGSVRCFETSYKNPNFPVTWSSAVVRDPSGAWRVFYYTVKLYKDITTTPVFIASYQVSYGDYYL